MAAPGSSCQAACSQVIGNDVQALDVEPKFAIALLQVQPANEVSVLFCTAPM